VSLNRRSLQKKTVLLLQLSIIFLYKQKNDPVFLTNITRFKYFTLPVSDLQSQAVGNLEMRRDEVLKDSRSSDEDTHQSELQW